MSEMPLLVRTTGKPVLVVRPKGEGGLASLDLLAAINRARAEGASLCVLPAGDGPDGPLSRLVTPDVPMVAPAGLAGTWLRARWTMAAAVRSSRHLLAAAGDALRLEWHRELRRYAGDERLPVDVRARLRENADAVLAGPRARVRAVPRQWLEPRVRVALPADLAAEASKALAACGYQDGRVMVAVEAVRRPDAVAAALAWLADREYQIVRIGEAAEPLDHPGVVEPMPPSVALDVHILLRARFVVCESSRVQHLALLTGTPSLRVNASDPLSAYPVRSDSLFTMRTPIDLDTGRAVKLYELLSEQGFRRLRTLGFRDNREADVLAAVREMHDGVTGGWREDDRQRRFRAMVGAAAPALAARFPAVAALGVSGGFVGDGRLARWQAEQVA